MFLKHEPNGTRVELSNWQRLDWRFARNVGREVDATVANLDELRGYGSAHDFAKVFQRGVDGLYVHIQRKFSSNMILLST
jgi:hypothetical protein